MDFSFRAIALFNASVGIRSKWLGDWHGRVGPISKIFSVIFPSVIIGLLDLRAVQGSGVAYIGVSVFTSTLYSGRN